MIDIAARCLLIEDGKRLLLIDTGMGNKQSEKFYSAGSVRELRKTVHSLIAIADQIGLQTLARVAGDVVTCIDSDDWIALGATFSRLIRSSDQSLTAIWDLQDVTV